MRWKAVAEIYKMHSFAPFSKLILLLKIVDILPFFKTKFAKFVNILLEFIDLRADFYRNFTKSSRRNPVGSIKNIRYNLRTIVKICEI